MCSIIDNLYIVTLNLLFFHFHLCHINNVCHWFEKLIENLVKQVFRLYNPTVPEKEFGLYNPNRGIFGIK